MFFHKNILLIRPYQVLVVDIKTLTINGLVVLGTSLENPILFVCCHFISCSFLQPSVINSESQNETFLIAWWCAGGLKPKVMFLIKKQTYKELLREKPYFV